MPVLFDRAQLHEAVHDQAIPALEAIATNDNLRRLHRFERDDPPPYVSSTESEELDDFDLIPPQHGGPLPEELKALMCQPFSQDELDSISGIMHELPRPDDFYYTEAYREYHRIDTYRRGPRPPIFRQLDGSRRLGVIARHLVKRRWQKLGVWNTNWGFAGRKLRPSDDFEKWTWWWQPVGAADDPHRVYQYGRELVARALRLRQNLRRGEYAPAIPRSHLGPDATAAEAEAFLISRPWFLFQIEVAEENARHRRLSSDDERRYPHSGLKQVIKWWKERGDWRDEFNRTSWVTSWKWRHESPSPEPEDIAPLEKMKDSPLDAAEEMEFTPSEIDELETIDLPESEQPEGFWVIRKNDWSKHFPGEMIDQGAEIRERMRNDREREERLRAEGRHVEPPKSSDHTEWPLYRAMMRKYGKVVGLFDPLHPLTIADVQELGGESPEEAEAQEDVEHLPPQGQHRLLVDSVQDQDQPLPPPPRRSARIAAMKRRAEPLPAQTEPNKRRRRAAPQAAVPATSDPAVASVSGGARARAGPVPAQEPPKDESETGPRRGRGLARRESGPSRGSAVQERLARTVGRTGTENVRGVRTAVNGEKRRLRPRPAR